MPSPEPPCSPKRSVQIVPKALELLAKPAQVGAEQRTINLKSFCFGVQVFLITPKPLLTYSIRSTAMDRHSDKLRQEHLPILRRPGSASIWLQSN